jgi:hypothetical protein
MLSKASFAFEFSFEAYFKYIHKSERGKNEIYKGRSDITSPKVK